MSFEGCGGETGILASSKFLARPSATTQELDSVSRSPHPPFPSAASCRLHALCPPLRTQLSLLLSRPPAPLSISLLVQGYPPPFRRGVAIGRLRGKHRYCFSCYHHCAMNSNLPDDSSIHIATNGLKKGRQTVPALSAHYSSSIAAAERELSPR